VGCKQPQICPLKLILAFTNSEGGDLVLKQKNLPRGGLDLRLSFSLMVPLKAGIGTLLSRLPGDHRASSLPPLFMTNFYV